MQWRRVDPVQHVGGLLAVGETMSANAQAQLAGKSKFFDQMLSVRGEGWIAWFAAKIMDENGQEVAILPQLSGTLPLYEEAEGWWLPVGVAFDWPEAQSRELRQALCVAHAINPPFALIPRFVDSAQVTSAADIYIFS